MNPWFVTPEFHVSPATYFHGMPVHSLEFNYAVRREDGSLLYRTESDQLAHDIVERLFHTHEETT